MRPAPLTGLAVGDALGVQFETSPFTDPRLQAWDGSFGASVYHGLKKGQWSDDTMMAKLLAVTLTEERGYSPLHASKLYTSWLNSGDLRGMGHATKQALTRLRMGMPWTQSGTPGAQGNGTAMRVSPIGVYYRHNIQAVAEMARVDATITHLSNEAEVGSVAVALAVAMLCQGIPKGTLPRLLSWLPGDTQVAKTLGQVFAADLDFAGGEGPGHVMEIARRAGSPGANVVMTVPAAFFIFMSTNNFKDAVEAAVRAGGDTDTTAAIVGTLAGTLYGTEQVDPYLEGLEEAKLLRYIEERLVDEALPVYLP